MQAGKFEGRARQRTDGEYITQSPTKGTLGARFDVEIVGPEGCVEIGESAPWSGWFSDDSAKNARTVEQITLAGGIVKPDGDIDWSGLGTTTFPCVVALDSYSGEWRVQWINSRLQEMPSANAAAKEALKARLAGVLASRPPTTPGGVGTSGKDDIPF